METSLIACRRLALLFISLWILVAPLLAQSDCETLLGEAEYAYEQGAMKEALIGLQYLETCDFDNKLLVERQSLHLRIFEAVDEQIEAINAAKELLETQQRIAKEQAEAEALAKEKMTAALAKATAENEHKQKIIDAFHFHRGNLALASRKQGGTDKYGFINKEGDTVIELKYDHIQHFDSNGFAIAHLVKDGKERTYLLDEMGTEYPVVQTIEAITPTTKAIDLRGVLLKKFPTALLEHPQLEIVLLDGTKDRPNDIKSLPKGINTLRKLKTLSLENCQLNELPTEIGKLKKMEVLNLKSNSLSSIPSEIKQLKQLKNLNLALNSLSIIPTELQQLKKLEHLNLQGNSLKNLLPQIGQHDAVVSSDSHFSEVEKQNLRSILPQCEILF